jgi:hypothetical protein
MSELILSQHVKWREQYVSAALNKKFSGVTEPGVYYGYELSPGGGMSIMVSPGEDHPESVAVVERDGYSITVSSVDPGTAIVPSTGDYYVCLEAYYNPTDEGYQQIVFRGAPEDHHVILGRVSIPAGTTEITEAMITEESRVVGNPVAWLLELMTMYANAQTDIIGLDERLTNIENWAKGLTSEPYDPETLYMGS